MTVVAYRHGVMAADSGAAGDFPHPWARKLARGLDGTLYGVAGVSGECSSFLRWVAAGCPQGEMPMPRMIGDSERFAGSFCVLVARSDPEGRSARISVITAYGEEEYPDAPYLAIGAAAECALGAMHAGAGAVDAVRAAIVHGSGAFGEVRAISREELRK